MRLTKNRLARSIPSPRPLLLTDRLSTKTNLTYNPESMLVSALETSPVLYRAQFSDVRMVRLCDTAVMKAGANVMERKAATMRMVSRYIPTIRLPRVLRSFTVTDGSKTKGYIVMDQLVSYIYALRAYIPPPNCIPRPIGGGVACGTLFSDYGSGPFFSVADLTNFYNGKLALVKSYRRAGGSDFSEDEFLPLRLVHLDIASHNAILDKEGNVWLMEWEMAGFYPSYFKKATLRRQVDDPDFVKGLEKQLRVKCDDPQEEERVQRLARSRSVVWYTPPTKASEITSANVGEYAAPRPPFSKLKNAGLASTGHLLRPWELDLARSHKNGCFHRHMAE
ncbi:hypothetical protein K440DRAFT_645009 [Wilcoxina mikolae CBS 423.85]|nr:hypothetical protein K440DRAFT_645009 [Wilcoxina mikolae CBS 423.85]